MKHLYIGLDKPDSDTNKRLISNTHDLVDGYKINFAAYEAQGLEGLAHLSETLYAAKQTNLPIIGDSKRVDIGPEYAQMVFNYYGFDAATVHPYMGIEAIEPFLVYKHKMVYILCRTSNRPKYQEIDDGYYTPLYCRTAELIHFDLFDKGMTNIGLVMGATDPEAIGFIREFTDMTLLIPGIGPQGGSIEKVLKAAQNNFIITVSRLVCEANDPRKIIQNLKEQLKA